jgi:hypothetical protein
MVNAKHFFDNNPAILNRCIEVNHEINDALKQKKIADNEVSFDLILPFLFEDIKEVEAKSISKELRLHREIVDCYNSGIKDASEFSAAVKKISSLKPVTYSQYQIINKASRKYLKDDLISSYLLSTERVYYRFQILDKLKLDTARRNEINKKVKEFSAFLLFDDDIFDLEADIATDKKTILTQYLMKGNHLDKGVEVMTQLIKNGSDIFEQFTNHFKNIYTND